MQVLSHILACFYPIHNFELPVKEMPSEGYIIDSEIVDGKVIGKNIRYVDFVITIDGELVIGSKHHLLGQGQDVLAAGVLKIGGQGQIKLINNLSGHYQPTTIEASQYASVFSDLGINLNNTFISTYQIVKDHDGFVIGRYMTKTEQIKGGY